MTEAVWAAGDRYEPYMGRWSRLVAAEFVEWLEPTPGARWVDVGCGTGALSETISTVAQPASVTGVDRSPAFVEYARERLPAARFEPGDATSLPLPDDSVDYAVSGLVLNFVPEPELAVAEMARVCVPGGTVAAYVWDYAEGMQLVRTFWTAALTLDPQVAHLNQGEQFPLCRPPALEELFGDLDDVQWRAITVPLKFMNFDDYWSPFLGGTGPAPAYVMSLAEGDRTQLRDLLEDTLAPAGGPIELTARAWAIRGTTKRPAG